MKQSTDLPRAAGIYLLTHNVTGDTYVGSSKSIRARFHSHISELKTGGASCSGIHELATEHGIDFACSVLELCDRSQLHERERAWITRLSPTLNRATPPATPPRIRAAAEKVGIAARVPASLLAALAELAQFDDRTISYMIERAIREFIERHSKPHKQPRSK